MRRVVRFLQSLPSTTASVAQQRRHVSCMLGVPFSKGQVGSLGMSSEHISLTHTHLRLQGRRGTEHGPALLRSSNLLERLRKIGTDLSAAIDTGSLRVDHGQLGYNCAIVFLRCNASAAFHGFLARTATYRRSRWTVGFVHRLSCIAQDVEATLLVFTTGRATLACP